jgi:hypothetical protein
MDLANVFAREHDSFKKSAFKKTQALAFELRNWFFNLFRDERGLDFWFNLFRENQCMHALLSQELLNAANAGLWLNRVEC